MNLVDLLNWMNCLQQKIKNKKFTASNICLYFLHDTKLFPKQSMLGGVLLMAANVKGTVEGERFVLNAGRAREQLWHMCPVIPAFSLVLHPSSLFFPGPSGINNRRAASWICSLTASMCSNTEGMCLNLKFLLSYAQMTGRKVHEGWGCSCFGNNKKSPLLPDSG